MNQQTTTNDNTLPDHILFDNTQYLKLIHIISNKIIISFNFNTSTIDLIDIMNIDEYINDDIKNKNEIK